MTKFKKGDRAEVLDSILGLPDEAKGRVCEVIRIFNDGRVIQIDWEHIGSTEQAWITISKNLRLVKKRP